MIQFLRNLYRDSQLTTNSRYRRRNLPSVSCEILEERIPLTFVTSETHVNTTTTGTQDQSETAANASGASVVVWASQLSSTDWDIKAQRFDANGNKAGGEINVATSLRIEDQPAVSMDSAGYFVVVWVDKVSSTNTNIMAQRFTATGAKRGSLITVANESKNEYRPSVASASNGDFVVAYTRDFSSTDQDVKAKRFSDSGTLLGTISVATSTADDESHAIVARAPDGRFAIAYQVDVGSGSNSDITLKRYSATGVLVNTHNIATGSNDQERPSVSMDNNANCVVVWREFVGGDFDIKARTVSNTGTAASTVTIAATSSREVNPDVAFRRSGGIYVVSYTLGDDGSSTRQVNVKEVTSSTGAIRNSLSAATSTASGSISFGSGDFYGLSYTALLSRSNDPSSGIFGRLGQV